MQLYTREWTEAFSGVSVIRTSPIQKNNAPEDISISTILWPLHGPGGVKQALINGASTLSASSCTTNAQILNFCLILTAIGASQSDAPSDPEAWTWEQFITTFKLGLALLHSYDSTIIHSATPTDPPEYLQETRLATTGSLDEIGRLLETYDSKALLNIQCVRTTNPTGSLYRVSYRMKDHVDETQFLTNMQALLKNPNLEFPKLFEEIEINDGRKQPTSTARCAGHLKEQLLNVYVAEDIVKVKYLHDNVFGYSGHVVKIGMTVLAHKIEAAAITIQKAFRGWSVRKSLPKQNTAEVVGNSVYQACSRAK